MNNYIEGDITTPIGGFKERVFFSRDKPLLTNRQYTEMKTILVHLDDQI
ncbi:MAG: hypothetical protein PHC45_00990 [Clostridiaceae bacterium]|nr:hypothetical protein [Clostridiaceae bacterium]